VDHDIGTDDEQHVQVGGDSSIADFESTCSSHETADADYDMDTVMEVHQD